MAPSFSVKYSNHPLISILIGPEEKLGIMMLGILKKRSRNRSKFVEVSVNVAKLRNVREVDIPYFLNSHPREKVVVARKES